MDKEKISDLLSYRENLIKEIIESFNELTIKVSTLESLSGFSIDELIELYKKGFTLKKEE